MSNTDSLAKQPAAARMHNAQSLQKIYLNGNLLQTPPDEVSTQGTQAIIDYLQKLLKKED